MIGNARALTEDAAIIEASSRKAQTLAGELLTLCPQIKAYEKRIRELFRSHPDAAVFSGIPGAGEVMSPRLLCAFGTDRSHFETAQNMTQWNGSAPVTINSGQDKRTGQPKRMVNWRWAAPTFVRQSFVEFAEHSIRNCAWAKAFYQIKKRTGQNPAKPFFVPSLSSGPAFCFAVGKIANATMSKSISNRSNAPVHRCGKDFSKQMPTPCKHNMRKNSKNPLTDYLSFLSDEVRVPI